MIDEPVITFPFVGIVVLVGFLYASYSFILWVKGGGLN